MSDTMRGLFRFRDAAPRSRAVAGWLAAHEGPLGGLARRWFAVLQACGDDVREVMHDGHATACVGDAAFAYVGVYRAHVTIGFYQGAGLPDPTGVLEGTGKAMRHVKRHAHAEPDDAAVEALIRAAYLDIRARLGTGS